MNEPLSGQVRNPTTHMAVSDSVQTPTHEYWRPPRDCWVRLNRCNVPSSVIACLDFQERPLPLELDGVMIPHRDLFRRLERLDTLEARAVQFKDYMTVHFQLDAPEKAGFDLRSRVRRDKADYLSLLRGWLFNPDGREGAVMKGWVASRFGLLPRYFGGRVAPDSEGYQRFLAEQGAGVYNANALESQLDLLYTFCQYALLKEDPEARWLTLYRGVNRLESHDIVARLDRNRVVVLLNNLNSFTPNRERADEFGDRILKMRAPRVKVLFYSSLLPGVLKGEEEYLVIGGLHEVALSG